MLRYYFGKDSVMESYSIINRQITAKLPFFVTEFGKYDCPSEYFTERDGLSSCLLFYTLDGQGLLRYGKGEYLLSKHRVAVINCRNYQYYSTASNDRWQFIWIHFDGKCAEDMVDILNEGALSVLDFSNRPDFYYYFEKLQKLEQSMDKNRELVLSNLMNDILSELIQHHQRSISEQRYAEHFPRIEYAATYMMKNYSRKITIDELAGFAISANIISSCIFQCVTGDTPYTFLTLCRLKQAKKLLLESNASVGEIACIVGYPDVKNFIAAFKKHVGVTPLQFRKTPRV